MKKVEKIMADVMAGVMLDCDKATYFISKSDISKLACVDRLRLKMHLLSCKYCRRYAEQSKFIINQIKLISADSPDKFKHHLTESQKSTLKKQLDIEIDNK